jgi:hypothetical protein
MNDLAMFLVRGSLYLSSRRLSGPVCRPLRVRTFRERSAQVVRAREKTEPQQAPLTKSGNGKMRTEREEADNEYGGACHRK